MSGRGNPAVRTHRERETNGDKLNNQRICQLRDVVLLIS